MPRRTPTEAATKWMNNLSAATTEIEIGVNKVQQAPSEKAIAQKAKMIDNWMSSMDSGKWENNLRKVDLATWKRLMIDVGIRRIRDGATKALPKLTDYYTRVFPQMQALENTIAGMPSRDITDSLRRVEAWMNGMRQISNSS